MLWVRRGSAILGLALLATLTLRPWATSAEPPRRGPSRFTFQVVQSFDAKYLGDTPGHLGRGGGLGEKRPDVALGDAVHRGNEKIGTITGLTWDRSRESLEVEFDPLSPERDPAGVLKPPRRIAIGDEIWIELGHPPEAAPALGR